MHDRRVPRRGVPRRVAGRVERRFVALGFVERELFVDEGGRHLSGGGLGPVREVDRTGDRFGRRLDGRTLDAGGVGAGIEREPKGGSGTGGRRLRTVTEARHTTASARRDIAPLDGLRRFLGPDDPDTLGGVG